MDKMNFLGAWFGTSITATILASLFLLFISTPEVKYHSTSSYRLYQALPQNQLQDVDQVSKGDGRALILQSYFLQRGSELALYSDQFVTVADKYHLDFRLLPAIAMQESNGGKRTPNGSYNPFGFGIYGSKLLKFDSWEDGIETVGRALRENYLNIGLRTPEEIMAKYTPPSLAKGGSWAKGVTQFMEELE